MNQPTARNRIAYFGKIPSRGDFVKNTSHPQLVSTLDGWLAQTMELLVDDPQWKAIYDASSPLHFAFLGSHSKLGIAGHLVPSRDASSRRYPFLTAATFEIARPMEFIAHSPMAFTRLWQRMASGIDGVMRPEDATHALQALNDIDAHIGENADGFDSFMELQNLERIEHMLRSNGHAGRLHDVIIAIGLLLEPVMASGSSHLDKGLILPLPDDPLYRNLVAQFWMSLVAPFLSRADFELALFLGKVGGKQRLVIGFSGASAHTLATTLTPNGIATGHIVLEEAPWVRNHIGNSHGLTKLSSYLDQPQLSLRVALDTFREVFIGA